MSRHSMPFLMVTVLLLAGSTQATADGGAADTFAVSGIVGLAGMDQGGCVAVWVPLTEGQALAGFKWYNNDGSTAFPSIRVLAGGAGAPDTLDFAMVAGEAVLGRSSGWSEFDFGQPLASPLAGLMVVLELPAFAGAFRPGVTGGPGIGYCAGSPGLSGWFSSDGMEWTQLSETYHLAALPILTTSEGALVVQRSPGKARAGKPEKSEPFHVQLLSPSPNPCNPKTAISFQLNRAARVGLSIYDIRGRLVQRLCDGEVPAGKHTYSWAGTCGSGGNVSSGVYFARLACNGQFQTQRVTLVR